jgi:hypothetical protein
MRKKRLKKENKISQLTTNILQAIHKTLHFISVEKSSYNRHKCIILWTLSGKQIVLVPIVSADMLQSSRQWTQQTRTLIHRFYGERRQFHCNMLLKECVCVCVCCVCVCVHVFVWTKTKNKYTPKMEKAVEHAEPNINIWNGKLQNPFNGI